MERSIVDKEPMVTITSKLYNQLQEDARFLRCLEHAGVDNWEGYGFAIDEFNDG